MMLRAVNSVILAGGLAFLFTIGGELGYIYFRIVHLGESWHRPDTLN
jgi:hypothetical protein